jgi:hypothetical protein
VVDTRRAARVVAAGLVAVASSAALTCGAVMLAATAHAAFVDVPPTGAPGRLVLASDPYPAEFLDLSPGDLAYWEVAARLENATRATLALELRKAGTLIDHPRGLRMTVDSCRVEWAGAEGVPTCPVGGRRITVATPADDYSLSSPTFDLRPLAVGAPEYLLITLGIEDSPEAAADETLMGLRGTMAVGLIATALDGDPVDAQNDLPATGIDAGPLLAAGALAAGLLGLGTALRLSRKDARA